MKRVNQRKTSSKSHASKKPPTAIQTQSRSTLSSIASTVTSQRPHGESISPTNTSYARRVTSSTRSHPTSRGSAAVRRSFATTAASESTKPHDTIPTKSFADVHRDPSYMTNPIFYVNGEPHIGHLYTMLVTDTISRWKQVQGKPVYVMSGTDEHGIKVQEASVKAGYNSPQQYCDDIAKKFQDAWTLFDVNAQSFLRTTGDTHKETVQQLWRQLARNGHIRLGKHEGWYCKSDEAFIPESQLIKHPDGSFKTALGQEVIWLSEENFKFHIKPFIEPLLQWYKANPLAIQPESQYNNVIGLLESEGMDDISVSRLSSKLSWGIDIPDDCEYYDPETNTTKKGSDLTSSQHKVYVWLDALAIYLTGAKQARQELQQHGAQALAQSYKGTQSPSYDDIQQLIEHLSKQNSPQDYTSRRVPAQGSTGANRRNLHEVQSIKPYNIFDETKWLEKHPQQRVNQHYADTMMDTMKPFWPPSVQLLGKDIVKFHAVYWPAFLMGAGLPLPRQLLSHCHWLVNDQKMSKSLGNVLSPVYLAEKYGMENTKYALVKTSQLAFDGNFNEDAVLNLINADLSDNLGNLSMRATSKNILLTGVYPDPIASLRENISLVSSNTDNRSTNGVFDHTATQWFNPHAATASTLFGAEELQLQHAINQLRHDFQSNMDILRFDRAFDAVIELGRLCNGYFTEYEPWVMAKRIREGETNLQPQLDMVLYHCIEVIRICSIYLQIITPNATSSLLDQLSVPTTQRSFDYARFGWRPEVITPVKISSQGPAYLDIDGVDVLRDTIEWSHIQGTAQVVQAPFSKIILESGKKLKGEDQKKAQELARQKKKQQREEQRLKQQEHQRAKQAEKGKEATM